MSSYAVGVIKGNQLVLVPLDFTLQLRPNMSYLQTSECVECWICWERASMFVFALSLRACVCCGGVRACVVMHILPLS